MSLKKPGMPGFFCRIDQRGMARFDSSASHSIFTALSQSLPPRQHKSQSTPYVHALTFPATYNVYIPETSPVSPITPIARETTWFG